MTFERPVVLPALAIVLAGCQSPAGGPSGNAWSSSFSPPRALDTSQVHLEPLTPEHAALDYEAFMSSREHLHQTLHWGTWPRVDMKVEENRDDLKRHEREFADREGYAFTVLRPDRTGCLGCVYIEPVENNPSMAELSYWVTEAGVRSALDHHLLGAVLRWIADDWPFESVIINVHTDNRRGIELAEALNLARFPNAREDHVAFVWHRT